MNFTPLAYGELDLELRPNVRNFVTSSKMVAVVVPMYNREELTSDEEVSFRHLVHFLGKYDKYLLVPPKLNIARPGFYLKRFESKYFGSPIASTRLMLSSQFYKAFSDYKYILIYHLDALVFSDQLLDWCEAGFDYIGAPWLKCAHTPHVTLERVGNGGLSLRKIESFLKVINSTQYQKDPDQYWRQFCATNPTYARYLSLPKKYIKRFRRFNGARWEMSRWHLPSNIRPNEDLFWSDEAIKYYPDFKIASVDIGLKFAFEVEPRKCFDRNNRTLPFGCHAWPRYDRSFWEPYLLK